MENINPMELLKEDMDSEELAVRVNAMHRVRLIATLLGIDGIKT